MSDYRVIVELSLQGHPHPEDVDVWGSVDCDGEVRIDEAVFEGKPIVLSADQRQAAEIRLFEAWENREEEL